MVYLHIVGSMQYLNVFLLPVSMFFLILVSIFVWLIVLVLRNRCPTYSIREFFLACYEITLALILFYFLFKLLLYLNITEELVLE